MTFFPARKRACALPANPFPSCTYPKPVSYTHLDVYKRQTEINLHTPALLHNDYAPDVHERLTLYKRLANGESIDDIMAMHEELVDRFGELPPQAQSLLDSHRLRLLCKPLGIIKLDASSEQIVVHFEANPPIDPMRIINLIQKDRNFKLAGQDKLLSLIHI